MLQSQLGSWKFKIQRNCRDGRLYFGDGWSDFAQNHLLQEMLFLQFKHIGNKVLQVTIITLAGEEKMFYLHRNKDNEATDIVADSKGKGKEVVKVETVTTENKGVDKFAATVQEVKGKADAAASGSTTGRIYQGGGAHFEAALEMSTHIIKIGKGPPGQLAIRREFVRETNKHKATNVILRGSDGKEFDIRVRTYVHTDGKLIVIFGKGWKHLHDRYNLKKGDGVRIEAPFAADGAGAPAVISYKIVR